MCGLFEPHRAESLDVVEGAEGRAPGRELGLPAILAADLVEMVPAEIGAPRFVLRGMGQIERGQRYHQLRRPFVLTH